MKHYFLEKNDPETAGKFHLSSMEFVRSHGGNPLCLVTELPLFLISSAHEKSSHKEVPETYLEFKEKLSVIRAKLSYNNDISCDLAPFRIKPLALQTAVSIQFQIIEFSLQTIIKSI